MKGESMPTTQASPGIKLREGDDSKLQRRIQNTSLRISHLKPLPPPPRAGLTPPRQVRGEPGGGVNRIGAKHSFNPNASGGFKTSLDDHLGAKGHGDGAMAYLLRDLLQEKAGGSL